MSTWLKATEIDIEEDELNILCGTDYNGNIYCTVKLKDIFKALSKANIANIYEVKVS